MNRHARIFCATLALLSAAGCRDGAHDGPRVLLSWGGPGRDDGLFLQPRAIAAGLNRLYIVDKTGRIQLFGLDGAWIASWTLPQVNRGYPTGLGVRPDGRLAVADTHNYVVRLYDLDGRELGTTGGEGGETGKFTYLTDVEFDGGGNMFVSEHGRVDRVQKFDPRGRFLAAWGRSGDAPGQFRRPQALAVDSAGCVFVADAANHRVQKFSNDGALVDIIGSAGSGPGQLLYPYDLALGPNGSLIVCEYGNNRVQAFDKRGRSIGCQGRPGRAVGELATPWGITWVRGRGLYVVDNGNHRVQLFAVPDEWFETQ